MFASIENESDIRIREVRFFLEFIKNLEDKRKFVISDDLRIMKGLFFVHLYSVVEFTIVNSVISLLQKIREDKYSINQFKPGILSIVLDSECRSLADSGFKKVWERRWILFDKIFSSDEAVISDTIIPTDGMNFKYPQLASIQRSLCMIDPIIPENRLIGRLEELAENRNAVAHGRKSPVDIGSRYTVVELEQRFNDINLLCSHLITVFKTHYVKKSFLK